MMEKQHNASAQSHFRGITFGLGEEKRYFVENLGLLLESGMGLIPALKTLKRETKSGRMKRLITAMEEDIDNGFLLWECFDRRRLLPERSIALIRIGEQTGKLHTNLRIISAEQQKDRAFRSRIRSAMIYPVIVFTLSIVVGLGVAWFVFPRLAGVFQTLDVDLPLVTRILIKIGVVLGSHGAFLVPLFLSFVGVVLFFLFVYRRTRRAGEMILLAIPGVKQLLRQVELARFGYLLRILLEAGLPITESLGLLSESATLTAHRRFYKFLQGSIEEGNSFERSFAQFPRAEKLIPLPLQQMIIAAEQSGHLTKILKTIEEIYEEKVEITSKNLAVILEPILLVVVWFGVLAVALAVVLPIYSLVGGLSRP